MNGLIFDANKVARCWWPGKDPFYQAYHDTEWGRPVTDDIRLFEKLCLEGFQAGLSWITILRKRENFRAAFAGFDPELINRFEDEDIGRLIQDEGIVRHRGKIISVINNARLIPGIQQEFGSFSNYIWGYQLKPENRPKRFDKATLAANSTSEESVALSNDLRRRGFSFVGPTTVYAFMQAMGLVNDHIEGCSCRAGCEEARLKLRGF